MDSVPMNKTQICCVNVLWQKRRRPGILKIFSALPGRGGSVGFQNLRIDFSGTPPPPPPYRGPSRGTPLTSRWVQFSAAPAASYLLFICVVAVGNVITPPFFSIYFSYNNYQSAHQKQSVKSVHVHFRVANSAIKSLIVKIRLQQCGKCDNAGSWSTANIKSRLQQCGKRVDLRDHGVLRTSNLACSNVENAAICRQCDNLQDHGVL